MAQRLKNILDFGEIAPGQSKSLAHLLNDRRVALTPDLIVPSVGGFSITADEFEVTAINNRPGPASLLTYVEHWHTIERSFGAEQTTDIQPQPYVPDYGTGIDADELVKTTASDAVAEFLFDKVVDSSTITKQVVDKGNGNLALELSAAGAALVDELVKVSAADVMAEFLFDKLVDSATVTKSIVNKGGGILALALTAIAGAIAYRTIYNALGASTMSPTFIDGVGGSSIVVPSPGDYFALWHGEAMNSSANTSAEVGISVDSTTVPTATSEQTMQGVPADLRPFLTTVPLVGLAGGELVRGLFRRLSGTGTVTLSRRRLWLFQVA